MHTDTETDDYFSSYEEWHEAMTDLCGITLTGEYCTKRVSALQDLKDPATTRFIELFGVAYRDKVVGWFERAGAGN